QWLTQTAKREQPAGQRIERIDQHDVVAPIESDMLKTIVEQKKIRREFLFHSLADRESIPSDADVCVARANEHLRFVSSQRDAGFSAARNNGDRLSGAPSITPREDCRIATCFAKASRDMRNHRRFPCPAHRQSADAYYRSLQR